MKYTFSKMKSSMPAWKREKDPVLTRIIYRPISFAIASICANYGVSANTISYLSALLAIIACLCFIIPISTSHIIGAVLCNVWLLMDCVDGNIARAVKKQPFGSFADSMSSYLLVGLLCTSMGIAAYFEGGMLFSSGCPWVILLGALASSSDSLMRLIYQKYINTERELADKGILIVEKDVHKDVTQVRSFTVRVDEELGIGGILPFAILIGTIFKSIDIVVIYCFCFFGASCIYSIILYMIKAIRTAEKYEDSILD